MDLNNCPVLTGIEPDPQNEITSEEFEGLESYCIIKYKFMSNNKIAMHLMDYSSASLTPLE